MTETLTSELDKALKNYTKALELPPFSPIIEPPQTQKSPDKGAFRDQTRQSSERMKPSNNSWTNKPTKNT